MRKLVADTLVDDNRLDAEEIDRFVFRMETVYPHHLGVAGFDRRALLDAIARRIAGQLGGEVEKVHWNEQSLAQEDTPTKPKSSALTVQTYASPALGEGGASNTYLITTEAGVMVYDAQRLLPEARRVVDLIGDRPVTDLIVSHAHSDHYGGLPVLAEAFPEAARLAAAETAEHIRDDPSGFNASRHKRHGEAFPTQAALDAAAPTQLIHSDQTLVRGDQAFDMIVLGPSHAEAHLLLYHPASGSLFAGDMVVNGYIPNAFVDLNAMITQIDDLTRRFPNATTIYPGSGPAGPADQLFAEQRAYLVQVRDLVAAALADGHVTDDEKQAIIITLENDHPHRLGAAGNNRRRMLGTLINRVVDQQTRGVAAHQH